MKKLIIQPNDTSQWYALINEAQAVSSCHLDEDLESYLVFLLMRFVSKPELASTVLAFDYLNSTKQVGEKRYKLLQDLGDRSLLFSGLFPQHALKKLVDIDYFVGMGQSAYSALSASCELSSAQLYAALCQDFLLLMHVLQATRTLSNGKLLTLSQAVEQLKGTKYKKNISDFVHRYMNDMVVSIDDLKKQKH